MQVIHSFSLMIVTHLYYLIIFIAALASSAYFLLIKHKAEGWEQIKGRLIVALLIAGCITLSGSLFTKNFVFIEEADGYLSHRVIECMGSPDITLNDGDILETKGLKTGIHGTWIFNVTDQDLVAYPVIYTKESLLGGDSKHAPDPYFIDSGCYEKVKALPSYYFQEPPKSITSSENWIVHLWTSIFGSSDTKWVLDVYSEE